MPRKASEPDLIAKVDADMRQLVQSERLPPAMLGMAEQVRVLARLVQDARAAGDPSMAVKAAQELRLSRALLAEKEVALSDGNDDDFANSLAEVSAAIRDASERPGDVRPGG